MRFLQSNSLHGIRFYIYICGSFSLPVLNLDLHGGLVVQLIFDIEDTQGLVAHPTIYLLIWTSGPADILFILMISTDLRSIP